MMIVIIILSQLLNFAFLKVISGIPYVLALGVVIVCLEIGFLIAIKISSYLNKLRLSEVVSQKKLNSDTLTPHQLLRLKASYRHPWVAQREEIFQYYEDRMSKG